MVAAPESIAPESDATPAPRRRDRADVAIIAVGQIFQQVLTLGTGIVIARLLGAAGYGLVNLLRSLFAAVSTVSPLGLDLALLKVSGQYASRPSTLDAIVQRLRLIAFGVNVVVALVIGFGFGGLLMRHVYPYPGFDRMLLVTVLGLPFGTDLAIVGAYYKGLNKPGVFALMTIYLQPVARVILIACVAMTDVSAFTIVCINTAQVLISFASVAVNLRLFKKRTGLKPADPPDWSTIRVIFSASVWMAVSLFVYGMMRFVDILFLGTFATPRDVGEYGALSTIAQLVQVYPLAASQTLGPNVSRFYHAGDMEGMKAVLGRYIYMASIIASFIFAGIAIFGTRLDLVFGHSFRFSADVAFLMPLGYLLSAVLAPTGYALSMTGRHRSESAILCIGAVSLVVLCWILIPILGQVGAAVASASSFMIINILRFAYVSRVLNFIPGHWRDLLPPVIALACAFVARTAIDLVADRTLIATIIACILYSALFGATCVAGLIKPADRVELLRVARRRLKGHA